MELNGERVLSVDRATPSEGVKCAVARHEA